MVLSPRRALLFAHGFGVDWDDRGLFPEIASWFPDHVPFFLRLGGSSPDGSLVARPLSEQAALLRQRCTAIARHTDTITAVCHSQGCVAAALAALPVERAILLAPPLLLAPERTMARFAQRPGSVIDPSGVSILARADGGRTLVGSACWQEMGAADPVAAYRAWAEKTQLLAVRAGADEVLEPNDEMFPGGVQVVEIATGHNFIEHRELLRALLERELERPLA